MAAQPVPANERTDPCPFVATVESTGVNSFFGKTATLIQAVDGLGNLDKILLAIMLVLTSLSLVLCFTAFGYLINHNHVPPRDALSFAVVLLVASIPVAIEIVVTTTLALGSRQLSALHAIVTRLRSIEELAGMNMLCSDKTGTLTQNIMQIQEYCPTFVPGFDKDRTLVFAALAAKWKEPPRDALDTMVLKAANLKAGPQGVHTPPARWARGSSTESRPWDRCPLLILPCQMKSGDSNWMIAFLFFSGRGGWPGLMSSRRSLQECDAYEQLEYMPFDPTQKRTEGTLREIATGHTFKVTKGAPNIILKLLHNRDMIGKVGRQPLRALCLSWEALAAASWIVSSGVPPGRLAQPVCLAASPGNRHDRRRPGLSRHPRPGHRPHCRCRHEGVRDGRAADLPRPPPS